LLVRWDFVGETSEYQLIWQRGKHIEQDKQSYDTPGITWNDPVLNRHVNHLMGHLPPLYSPCYGKVTWKEQIVIPEDVTEKHFAKPRMLMPVAAKCSVDSYTWEYIVASTTIFQSTSDFFHSEFNQYWIVGGC
jgi:hypothetical protein